MRINVQQRYAIDIAILGGGIAGLWSLAVLLREGYNAVLFEPAALGSGQTIASQGMIHGGLKYALAGELNTASEALVDMPARWRACIDGSGELDLRGVPVLSESLLLWSDGGMRGRLTALLASKALRGRVEQLPRGQVPAVFAHPQQRGAVYRMPEPVLDVPALVERLAEIGRGRIFAAAPTLMVEPGGVVLQLPGCTLSPQRLLLSAGAGNEGLLQRIGAVAPRMQRRPLQQVLVEHDYPEMLFGHCLGRGASPRLTVSSHRSASGRVVWYLGGDLATGAAGETAEALIGRARSELAALLPWVDLGAADWSTIALDRAEPLQTRGRKPDGAFLEAADGVAGVLVAWPVKLTLAPDLGNKLLMQLHRTGVRPRHPELPAELLALPASAPALPPWLATATGATEHARHAWHG
jgi:glycine/D-amino acid oxidase-like deaminating enzyme